MRKIYREHIWLLICFCLASLFNEASGADNASPAERKKVDSLNELAFAEKRSNIPKALNALFVSENLATSLNYQKGLATAYLYQAGIFHQYGYEKKALSTYYKSLQLFQALKDTFNIARASKEIAASLQANGKTAEAIPLFNNALNVYTTLKKKNEIANIKNSIGLIELDQKHIDKARDYFLTALDISIAEKYEYGEKKSYYNLGLLEEKLNNLAAAETYFTKSLEKDKKLHDKYGEALNQLELAAILGKQSRQDAAIGLTKEAYHNAVTIPAYNLLKEAATRLIRDYRQRGDNVQAGQWQDSLSAILQAQIDNEKEYAINFIDVIKNQDALKVNAENEVLKTKRVAKEQLLIITIGTFILIILAVLAVLALVNYQRQRFLGKELQKTNLIIEKNASSLDLLNKEISMQNLMLEEDNKTKNKLLSIISHDLRTPLVNTKGILNLMNHGMLPASETTMLIEQLEAQYQSTTSLLDNLLFWIKGQVSGNKSELVPIHFQQLIKGVEDEQRISLLKKNIQFENQVNPSLVVVAEKEMMRIVFRNLISNAIKFTPEKGMITVAARIEEGFAYLSVKDSGIGMTKETIEKVNARQYYNTKGTSLEKGSGFGLMLCHDLITRYGGEMMVESEPGKGSCFTIKLAAAT